LALRTRCTLRAFACHLRTGKLDAALGMFLQVRHLGYWPQVLLHYHPPAMIQKLTSASS
jgi:hypothetical protein